MTYLPQIDIPVDHAWSDGQPEHFPPSPYIGDIEALASARRELSLLHNEIGRAADVQHFLLPVARPRSRRFDFAAAYQPCHVLSGDFYDVFDVGGSVCFALGDVSGKGVCAALLMASLRACIRAHAADLGDLKQIMQRVNADFARDTRPTQFATLFLGLLDEAQCQLSYCSAGHEPPVLVREGQSIVLEGGGMALGIDSDEAYDVNVIRLAPGDILAVFTDGITEARDAGDMFYGRERAQAFLGRTRRRSAAKVCDDLLRQVAWFVGGAPQADDIAILTLRIRGKAAGRVPCPTPGPGSSFRNSGLSLIADEGLRSNVAELD